MDDIVKIAIIIGIIIIGITGCVVYFKIKKINEEDSYDEVEIDNKDTIKLDILSKDSNTLKKEDNVVSNSIKKDIEVEKSVPEVKIPTFQVKEVSKMDTEPKTEVKVEIKEEDKVANNRPYSNKYSSSSTLISPVGYYSNELVRNDLMGKRASKVEKPMDNEKKEEEIKLEPNTIDIEPEPKSSTIKAEDKIKEEKQETSNNKISFGDMKQTYVKKEEKPKNFMEEVSEKLSKELKPQTIELTDYEQKQEDEAIISYQELLANKDKTFNISDDEEDEDFISALKSFRDSL